MAYITQQDLIDELGEAKLIELTTDEYGATEPNEATVNNAIDYAVGVFESYVRARYSLPVPATLMVKSCCVNLAVYQLYRKRATFDDGVFKVKKTAFDETMSLLKDINKGNAALDVPAVEETKESPATGDKILTNASKSKFTDTKLSGF